MEATEVEAPKPKTARNWSDYWGKEKVAADKRVRDFIKVGNRIVKRYLDEGSSEEIDRKRSLNLFHKTVKTTMDMLYGRKPKIDVKREHNDPDDDPARVASYLFERMLEAGCESPVLLRAVLQDRLLPGLGVARVRYEMESQKITGIDGQETEVVTYEAAPAEYVHWQDFRWGWARTWDEVPWIGFRVYMSKDKVEKRFGEKVANNIEYKAKNPAGSNDIIEPEQQSHTHEAEIWEFWHKEEKKVFWWAEGAPALLDEKDDPLKLEKFWPIPRPMTANLTTSMYLPTADFTLAQDLYNEIDILQTRISRLTESVKLVGVYDQAAGGSVGRMMQEGHENDLIPVDNWAMFGEKGGLQGVIDWFPVDMVVNVLKTLAEVQDNKINQLYGITGLSTLMRGGDTDQYTSDGTNKLSAKFGSITVQALQDEFAQFASDLQALRAEVIAKHFMPQTIIQQANAEFIPNADKPLLMPAIALMKGPTTKWRIEISPESVAMVDYAQLQNERIAYLNAVSTFVQSAQAMLKQVPNAMPVLLEFMKFGLAGFKGSDYLEGILDQAIEMAMKAPPQQDDGGEMAKEQMTHQFKMQENQQKLQHDMQREGMKHQNATQQEAQKHQNDMQLELRNQQNAMASMMQEFRNTMAELQASLQADVKREEAQSTYAMAEEAQEHENTMKEQRAQRRPDDA